MYCAAPRAHERGFTLIELLIALVIVGILVVVAVPSYVGMRTRAADAATKSNLRAAIPAVEAFSMDNTGTRGDADNRRGTRGYRGMTASILRAVYNPGISPTLRVVSGRTGTSTYCLTDTRSGRSWSVRGPGVSSSSFRRNTSCR